MNQNVDFAPELSDSSGPSRYRLWRSRWAAIGAAVAVSFGAGGVFMSHADSPTTPTSFVAIPPVRVLDTRNDLGLNGVFTSPIPRDLMLTGLINTADGPQVAVPPGATAVVLNVTVVNPTASGFLSVRPADATGPATTSSINFVAGMIIANAVTVQLPTAGGDTGKIEITYDAFAVAGPTTHVLADVVGFYFPDTANAKVVLSGAGFTADANLSFNSGCARQTLGSFTVRASVQLPVGATITGIVGFVLDTNATIGTIRLVKATASVTFLATVSTPGAFNSGTTSISTILATPEVVGAGEYFYLEFIGGDGSASQQVCGAEVNYTIPAGNPGA